MLHLRKMACAAALAAFAAGAAAQTTPEVASGAKDRQIPAAIALPETPEGFAASAAASDAFEIESSRLALERSQNPAVRDYAERMIADHGAAAPKLAAAAQADGAPVDAPALDERGRVILTELAETSDAGFDAAYVLAQQAAHAEAVALFEHWSAAGGALGAYAAETLPTLVAHRERIDAFRFE